MRVNPGILLNILQSIVAKYFLVNHLCYGCPFSEKWVSSLWLCVHEYVGDHAWTLACIFLCCFPLYSRETATLTKSFLFSREGWPASSQPFPIALMLGSQAAGVSFLCGWWRFELGSRCLQSKRSYPLSCLPSSSAWSLDLWAMLPGWDYITERGGHRKVCQQ